MRTFSSVSEVMANSSVAKFKVVPAREVPAPQAFQPTRRCGSRKAMEASRD
jgi:hypothetical protein